MKNRRGHTVRIGEDVFLQPFFEDRRDQRDQQKTPNPKQKLFKPFGHRALFSTLTQPSSRIKGRPADLAPVLTMSAVRLDLCRRSEATPPGLSRENSRPPALSARTALRVRRPNREPVRRRFPPGPMPASRRQCS